MADIMTILAQAGTVVAHNVPAQTRRRTMLVSLATIAVIIGVPSVLACTQLERALPLLQLFLSRNRFSVVDVEILRILSAAFAPSIIGLLLAFLGSALREDGQQ
jgi:hypothetical protein